MAELSNYIPINRKIFSHDFWGEDRTYSRFEAWLDLIKEARYEDAETRKLIGNKYIKWGRGELVASLRFLAERWGWSKNKVDCYLKLLIDEQMISKRTATGTAQTVITICKYDDYNPRVKKDGHKKGQQKDTLGTAKGQQRDKTNEEEERERKKEVVEEVFWAKEFDENEDWQNRPFDTPDVKKEKSCGQKENEELPPEPVIARKPVPELAEALAKVAEYAFWRNVMEHFHKSKEERETLFKRFYEYKEDTYTIRMQSWREVAQNFYNWVSTRENVDKLQAAKIALIGKKQTSSVEKAIDITTERMSKYKTGL